MATVASPAAVSGAKYEALRTKCHTLLLADRYNVAVVLAPLEEAVMSQCNDNWYDSELNAALLKLYQMYPHVEKEKVVKVDILVRVLLKALMQLPETDFSLAMMMVPEHLQNLELIRTIVQLAEKLQTSSFPEFWDMARANPDLIHKVPGFQTACRRHILRVVGMTFREISAASLAKYLGLASARDLGGALAPEGLAFVDDSVGIVVLPSNSDNHPKTHRLTTGGGQEVRLEQLSDLIVTLEASTKHKFVGQGVSNNAKAAVQRMKQVVGNAPTAST